MSRWQLSRLANHAVVFAAGSSRTRRTAPSPSWLSCPLRRRIYSRPFPSNGCLRSCSGKRRSACRGVLAPARLRARRRPVSQTRKAWPTRLSQTTRAAPTCRPTASSMPVRSCRRTAVAVVVVMQDWLRVPRSHARPARATRPRRSCGAR